MLPYLSIFSLLALFGSTSNDRQARLALAVIAPFLLVFMGTRYYVGCDFTGYLHRFENVPEFLDSWSDIFAQEGGFGFIVGTLQEANADYMWLNVICTLIFLACLLKFCWSFQRPLLLLALLFPVMILQLGMSGLRQALAAGFLMLAYVQFVRGQRWWTAGVILIGGMFHTSVVMFLPIAFLAGKRITSTKIFLAIVLLTPAAGLLLQSRVEVYADRYINEVYGEVSSSGAFVRYALVAIPAIMFVKLRTRLLAAFPQMYGLFMLFTLIIFAMAPLAAVSTVALHRLNYYVMPVSILMLNYLTLIQSSPRRHTLMRHLAVILYGGYMVSWFLTSTHAAACYIPYGSYLFL